jgi:hypothetical protein
MRSVLCHVHIFLRWAVSENTHQIRFWRITKNKIGLYLYLVDWNQNEIFSKSFTIDANNKHRRGTVNNFEYEIWWWTNEVSYSTFNFLFFVQST